MNKTKIIPMKILLKKALFIINLLLISLISLYTSSQQNKKSPVSELEEEKTWEESFIQSNIAISNWFDGVAEGLDLFLVGKRVTSRPNKSNFKIESNTVSTEGHNVINSTSLSVNPRLPNLEEYWHLKFATYDERADSRNPKNTYLQKTSREKNYGATVGLFKKLGNIRAAFQPRIELQNPLRVSHSLTFESIADLKTYSINPKLEFYANPDKGVGNFHALNFYIKLTNILSVTQINQGDYSEKYHIYSVINGISLGQILNAKSALSYNLFFSSNNRPSYHLEGYSLSLGYSKVLYKQILDYQIVPNLDFQKSLGFKGVAGVNLNITLNF
jgi:hypothetical protein